MTLFVASLLTLAALLDLLAARSGVENALFELHFGHLVRNAASVAWVGYFLATVRDDLADLMIGNRDITNSHLRRLEKRINDLSDAAHTASTADAATKRPSRSHPHLTSVERN
ncbi:hypothetical protein [Umezawaea beigongshangensis]|uniref:hypothetical protein n=1 Tax=Umezawaea beigongshangensis TaxID=2780383 RepID=UPI0018F23F3B|nr:hypothetical protein [Umezawaea beigongshangensis]